VLLPPALQQPVPVVTGVYQCTPDGRRDADCGSSWQD